MIETIMRTPGYTIKEHLPPRRTISHRGINQDGSNGLWKDGYTPQPDYWPQNLYWEEQYD